MASRNNSAAGLDALILCGGLGTRLREETEFKPKPMVEVGGRPILWHILKHYSAFGAGRFVLCLGYKGDVIRSFAEKPQVTQGWINGGYFVFEKKAFDLMDRNLNEPLETSLLERLATMGELAVHHHRGFWQCMDTLRETQLLNDLWNSGAAPWRIWS